MTIRSSNTTRVLQNGTSNSSRIKNDLISLMNKQFSLSPSYYEVSINNNTTLIGVQITDNSSNTTEKVDSIRKIIMKHCEVLNVGDIVDWNTKKWLTTSVEMFSDIYYRGTIQECNNTLKFYKSGILYTVPCIFSDGNISLEEGKFMNLPSGHYMVTIPSGTIDKSDLTLRFILNNAPYKIVGINNATNGLVKIELEDDSFIEDDNKELGIANYYSNQKVRSVVIKNGSSASLLYSNATLQLNIECKEDGVIIENPTVVYSSNNTNVCSVSDSGLITAIGTGDAIITVGFGEVSASISMHCDVVVIDNYNITLTPSDTTLKLSRTIIITAHAFNNGIEDTTKQFNFIISNADGSSNNYVTYNKTSTTCSITASNSSAYINKFINVRAELSYDSTVFVEKQIKLISLI